MWYVKVKDHLYAHMFTMQTHFVAEHFAKPQITELRVQFILVILSFSSSFNYDIKTFLCPIHVKPGEYSKFETFKEHFIAV